MCTSLPWNNWELEKRQTATVSLVWNFSLHRTVQVHAYMIELFKRLRILRLRYNNTLQNNEKRFWSLWSDCSRASRNFSKWSWHTVRIRVGLRKLCILINLKNGILLSFFKLSFGGRANVMHYAEIETITFLSFFFFFLSFFSLFIFWISGGDVCTGHPPLLQERGGCIPPIPPGIYAHGSTILCVTALIINIYIYKKNVFYINNDVICKSCVI